MSAKCANYIWVYWNIMELMDLLIYQIGNEILLGFPWTVFLDPWKNIYLFTHTPWNFWPLDPSPPGISSDPPWGERYGYFLEPHVEARVQMEMKLQVFIEKVPLQVFLQLEKLRQQRRKSELCRACFVTVPKCI